MTERKPRSLSPEQWAERQIVDAIERGELGDGRLAGKPLDLSDGKDPDWWIRRKLRDEDFVALPPSLQLRRDRDEFLETLAELHAESLVRERAERLNKRIRYANSHGIDGPPAAMMPMDVDDVVARWRTVRPADDTPPAPVPDVPPGTDRGLRRLLGRLRHRGA